MSDVKAKVIAIVTGQEFLPKETIELKPDEVVVKRVEMSVTEAEAAERDYFVTAHRYAQGGIVADLNKEYIVGERSSCCLHLSKPLHLSKSDDVLPEQLRYKEQPGGGLLNFSAPDPTGTTEPLKKPFIRFKMLEGTKLDYIEPREGFWPHPLPRIVL